MANVSYQKSKGTKDPWAITETEFKVYEDKVFKPIFHCNEKDLTLSLKLTVEINFVKVFFANKLEHWYVRHNPAENTKKYIKK